MKKIELLAPAGGYEQFIAAVENGADAVYLGGALFNARSSANNFDDSELEKTIEYAHIRDVKIYITLNTLINDFEMEEAINFAKRACLMGADAFIVQDLGIAYELKKQIPGIKLHFSTQGSVYSTEGIKALNSFNFERVVLARELSLKEIKNVCINTDKEIEVFVHGAMCICYSGQCRLSSMIGGRSGNRGKCAQPCRLPYSVYNEKGNIIKNYALSPKDLCGIYDIPELIKSGATSLKIEGRMKSAGYVASVTRTYRKYIDMAYSNEKYEIEEKDIKELLQVFNRGGFTEGYFHKNLNKDFISRDCPKHNGIILGKVINYKNKLIELKLLENINMGDGVEVRNEELPGNIVTYIQKDGKQIKCAKIGDIVKIGDIKGNIKQGEEIYKISDKFLNDNLKERLDGKFYKKVPIDAELKVKLNEKIRLEISDDRENKVVEESEYMPEKAVNKPLTYENAQISLEKLGNTAYYMRKFSADIEENLLVPVSVLNELRRKTTEELNQKRAYKNSFSFIPNNEKRDVEIDNRETKISVYLYNTENLSGLEMADRVYLPIDSMEKIDLSLLKGKELIPYLYPITKGEKNFNVSYEKYLIGNIEHIEMLKGKEIYADYSMNAFNSNSCKALKDMGVRGVNLPFELNLEQIKAIETELELEITVYGRLPLMISEHCVIGSEVGGKLKCGECIKSDYYLEDRTGARFPIIAESKTCRNIILNSEILFAPEIVAELAGRINYARAYFFDESTEERRRILTEIKNGKKTDCIGYTAGHFYRGV